MKIPFAGADKSGLYKHGSLMVVGTFVGALCNAGFHMVVGRPQVLSNGEYGSLVAMFGIILVVSTPMLALQNTLAHYTAELVKAGRRSEAMGLFLHWVRLFAVLSAAIVAGAFVFRAPLAAFWGGVDPRVIVLTFMVMAATLWMSLFFGLLQGVQAFSWLAWAPQAWGVTRLVLGAVFTIFLSATALAALAAQGFGVLVVLGLCLGAVRTLDLPLGRAAERPRETYRYLGSAFVCLAGYAVLMNLDTVLAKHYFDSETVGLFAKAATIARIAVFLPVPIATVLFPKVTSTGDLSDESWGLLGRALAFAGLLIAAVVGVCLLWPQLPWMILYNAWSAADAAPAAALTRAMVLALAPLTLAYLLLNFEMAQRRFFWCYGLIPCGLAYVGLVARFHSNPLQIPAALGAANLAAAGLLLGGILFQRSRPRRG